MSFYNLTKIVFILFKNRRCEVPNLCEIHYSMFTAVVCLSKKILFQSFLSRPLFQRSLTGIKVLFMLSQEKGQSIAAYVFHSHELRNAIMFNVLMQYSRSREMYVPRVLKALNRKVLKHYLKDVKHYTIFYIMQQTT